HVHGADADVPGTARRKPAPSSRSPSLPAQAFALPGHTAASLCRARTRAEHLTWTSTLGTRALPPRPSAHDPVVRLAGAAHPRRHLKGRRELGTATRGRGPAPPGHLPEAALGRPGHGRLGAVAAKTPVAAPDRDARHSAHLAPAHRQEQMDLPECHRTTAGPEGSASSSGGWPGRTRGGAPSHPRRTPRPRLPHRRGNDPPDPGRRRAHARAAPGVTDLAAVPGLPGVGDPGG